MPEPIASSETKKDDGWSDSDAETEMTAKVTAANGDGDGWGDSDDEKPVVKTRTSSIIASGDEKSKVRYES